MLTLDEQLEAATRELHDRLGNIAHPTASTVIRRHRRRRHTVTGLTALFVMAAVVALGIVVTRDVEPVEPGSSVDPVADRLLFPPGISPRDVNEVMLGPDLGNTAKGLANSPSGIPFRIVVAESHGDVINPSLAQRTINGRQFTVESFEGQLIYTTINNCALVVVTQPAAGTTPWDTNASKVLEGLAIDGRTSTLTLPPGWQSFGAGTPGALIQLAYEVTIRGTSHNVNLMQISNSPVATVLNLADAPGPLTSTTFNNLPAWTTGSPDSRTALIWEDQGNAVSFSGELTLDELKQLAGDFQHNQAEQWARYLPSATTGAPPATSPAQDTIYSSAPSASTDNDCTTPPRLTINETP